MSKIGEDKEKGINFYPGGFDTVIHEKSRLGIMTLLLLHRECDFNFLKENLKLTDGNLSRHLQKLEVAGYIEVKKGYKGRRPHTVYRLSLLGKEKLNKYLKDLENLLRNLRT